MLSLKEKLVLIQGIKEALPTLEKKPRDHVEKILEGRQLTELRELELKEVYDVCLNPEKYYPAVESVSPIFSSLNRKIKSKQSKGKPSTKEAWKTVTATSDFEGMKVKKILIKGRP